MIHPGRSSKIIVACAALHNFIARSVNLYENIKGEVNNYMEEDDFLERDVVSGRTGMIFYVVRKSL